MRAFTEAARFHDHHSHVSLYASFLGLPDVGGLAGAEALALLGSLPEDRLSLVKGWRTDKLSLSRTELERLPPLVLVNASLHGFAASPRARPFIEKLWPELAERSADAAWGERSLPRLFSFYGRVAGLDAGKLGRFMADMESLGIRSIEDMTVTGVEALDLFASPPFAGRIKAWAAPEILEELPAGRRSECAGAKIFLDGSLGARSAALDAPFADGREGKLLYSDAELAEMLASIASRGCALSAHAIGHRAIEQALRSLESLRSEGAEFPSVRLEHVQFISESQARRCRERGYVLSMQPNFNADSVDYADRLTPRHRAENDPFRMLIDEAGFVPGVDLVFGSDGMPHGPAEAARTALDPAYPGQRLSLEEIEAGYSADAIPRDGETRL
jgi:hypothetical protein